MLLSPTRMREIAWELGRWVSFPFTSDYAVLCMVHPWLGQVHWHVRRETADALRAGGGLEHARLVVRVYDVTDVIFNGYNAHMFFDLDVGRLSGNYYFKVPQPARHYLAEAGFLAPDGGFGALARSAVTFFDRDRPSGDYQVSGLFGGGALDRVFPVENVFDAPVYERMNRELSRTGRLEPLSVAMVHLGLNHEAGPGGPVGVFIDDVARNLGKLGVDVTLFTPVLKEKKGEKGSLLRRIQALSLSTVGKLGKAHKRRPFHLVHCHDWYSSVVGLAAASKLGLPMVLTLHSTEHERAQGNMSRLSESIRRREERAVGRASCVIVPHSSTLHQAVTLYGAPPEKTVIIPDVLGPEQEAGRDPGEVKRWFGLRPDASMVLFCGEMSHAAGADLLVEALPTVCRNHGAVQFVFAGEGPLRAELEGRVWHAGLGHRCRFVGHVNRETFENLLAGADFVVIPARTWQDEGVAQAATAQGRPVLTTHQAGITCVVHGENGLVTFDNPGSIVWGIQELLHNPLGRRGEMLRLVARRREAPSLENVAVQHYISYETVLAEKRERTGA
jgi:glycosyltransferase involved in cell wall biosynthesis